jgi:hypothetical protein
MVFGPLGRSNLLYVYTDHHTLENFDGQKDLLRRQLRWQEYMSQFEISLVYVRGEDNTVADALSRLPRNCFDDERSDSEHVATGILKICIDSNILTDIKKGYKEDKYCKNLIENHVMVLGLQVANGLWYVGSRLLIP